MAKGSMPGGVGSVVQWGLGIGVLALIGLVMLILFGNLSGNIGFGQDSSNFYNSTITLSDTYQDVHTSVSGKVNPALSTVIVTNATAGGGYIVSDGNYSIVGGQIKTLTTEFNETTVNVSAKLSYDSRGKIDTDNLITNYTISVVNTSKQFPVVGTIVGIALLLMILIGILIFAINKLKGVTTTGGSGRSAKFEGSSNQDFS